MQLVATVLDRADTDRDGLSSRPAQLSSDSAARANFMGQADWTKRCPDS